MQPAFRISIENQLTFHPILFLVMGFRILSNLQVFGLYYLAFCSTCSGKTPRKIKSKSTADNRQERLFGLIRINNVPCMNNQQVGSCYSSTDCKLKGGTSIGTCAQGFGVCCLIVRKCLTSDSTISTTERVFTMTSSPEITGCTHEIMKSADDICQIQLDLATFSFDVPNEDGDCTGASMMRIEQSFTVSRFRLCGEQAGQRLYLTYGAQQRRISLIFRTANNNRYDVHVTQIRCNEKIVPDNCLQFFRDSAGPVRSFGFPNYLINNPRYNVCIRDSPEDARITWRTCTGAEAVGAGMEAFHLSRFTHATTSDPANLPAEPNTIGFVGKRSCDPISHVAIHGEDLHCGSRFMHLYPIESRTKPFVMSVSIVVDDWMSIPETQSYPYETGATIMPGCVLTARSFPAYPAPANCAPVMFPPPQAAMVTCACAKPIPFGILTPAPVYVNRIGFCLHYTVN